MIELDWKNHDWTNHSLIQQYLALSKIIVHLTVWISLFAESVVLYVFFIVKSNLIV